jgi:hypothetical protein
VLIAEAAVDADLRDAAGEQSIEPSRPGPVTDLDGIVMNSDDGIADALASDEDDQEWRDEDDQEWPQEWRDAYERDVLTEDDHERHERWAAADRERATAVDTLARWPETRLQAELDRLRALYFPELAGSWTVRHELIPTSMEECFTLGYLNRTGRLIVVDLLRRPHKSDRQIRTTLVHELCHTITGAGHGSAFFGEVERLLVQRAPIHERFSNYPNVPLILARLPECRRRYERQERRRQMRAWAQASWNQRRFPFLPSGSDPPPQTPVLIDDGATVDAAEDADRR